MPITVLKEDFRTVPHRFCSSFCPECWILELLDERVTRSPASVLQWLRGVSQSRHLDFQSSALLLSYRAMSRHERCPPRYTKGCFIIGYSECDYLGLVFPLRRGPAANFSPIAAMGFEPHSLSLKLGALYLIELYSELV